MRSPATPLAEPRLARRLARRLAGSAGIARKRVGTPRTSRAAGAPYLAPAAPFSISSTLSQLLGSVSQTNHEGLWTCPQRSGLRQVPW